MPLVLKSWNVNGIRATTQKEGWANFLSRPADILAFQETKAHPSQLAPEFVNPQGWHASYAASMVKKGYSGVSVWSKIAPLAINVELPEAEFQGEGRLLHLEYEKFHFINGYFPNGGAEVEKGVFARVPYKMGFFDAFLRYAKTLEKSKPIVVCGDFNIAHKAIDLARPKDNIYSTGFLPIERKWLDAFVDAGFVDTFRLIHGQEEAAYTWWSYKTKAREKNIGWRIDYFFVSAALVPQVQNAWIEADVFGSDHCPVAIELADF